MILFPNRTVVRRDDVMESVRVEFRKELVGAGPPEMIDQASWDVVDQASWESFPASDAPPWTLGYTGPPVTTASGGGWGRATDR